MKVTINFGEVPDLEVLPQGQYPVIIHSVQLRESKSSDYPYLNWRLDVVDGDYSGRVLWMMTSLSPKALWRAKSIFKQLGIMDSTVQLEVDEETDLIISPELAGRSATAVVGQEVYEGETRNRVNNLIASSTPLSEGLPGVLAKGPTAPPPLIDGSPGSRTSTAPAIGRPKTFK